MPENEDRVYELKKAYSRLFKSEDGQVVLADLEKSCFIHRTTADAAANQTFFNEGSRSVVLHIQDKMDLEKHKGDHKDE